MKRAKTINPARVMAAGFIGLIIIGSLLLSLPAARVTGELSYIDALFTAASAVCVTGLVVVDTGSFYSLFGQIIIMVLIFFGALGFMTMTTLIFIFLGRRITLRRSLIIKEILGQESIGRISQLVLNVFLMTIFFVLVGTVLLSVRYAPQLGLQLGFFVALFHAVSAFGNAGFDLLGGYTSLTLNPVDYLVNGTILVLFTVGGLGFTVIMELLNRMQFRQRLSLHSHLVLFSSAALLMGGTLLILALEYNNPETIGGFSFLNKVFTALFSAATPRTAGFSVLRTEMMHHSTLLVIIALMFIGASPTSTGGGVKTTTVGVVFITLVNLIKGRREPVVYYRRFPLYQIMRAVSIITAAIILVFITTLLLTIFEDQDFIALLFESVSAFGTVGLSTGITPQLSNPSKLVIIFTMLSGRIGPLSLLIALAWRKEEDVLLRYPEENLMIG
jgi:trk system potassium uptake protein